MIEESFVVWNDSLSVGFDPIDNQHKQLVDMTNELIQACKDGAVAADLTFMQTVDKAVDYAKVHFATEEKYMNMVHYPELPEHKKQHFQFLFDVVNVLNEVQAGNTTPIQMVRILKNWLAQHIAKTDMQYAPYLRKLKDLPPERRHIRLT